MTFCLVTGPEWVDRLPVLAEGRPALVRAWEDGESLDDVLASLPEPAHVLVLAPGRLVTSPTPDRVGARKLVCVPGGSTPMPAGAVAHALAALEATDPAALERRADAFFGTVGDADHLVVIDERAGTKATFAHLDDDYAWNQQAGFVAWGEQQLGPSGELSVLPADVMGFDPDARLAVDGELTLRGTPIVHGGAAPYTPEDQERRYQRAAHPGGRGRRARRRAGHDRRPPGRGAAAQPAADALAELFAEDERYRVLLEVGVGIHPGVDVLPGNRAVNEVHGGRHGVLHLGIGLTPDTTYAPIVLCPGSTVRTGDGTFVAGARPERAVRRLRTPSCGCS